ncbi:sugar ABC transporter permease [uncultured Clostridium sp.]|uniref:sugar ABC transporter permease n=1 Tax=uncultured Clostridium sp. TaxID=59620 RepID=UPI00262A1FA9|nr:sugar ABC transporter permease [uncultured Clostridium sp.]
MAKVKYKEKLTPRERIGAWVTRIILWVVCLIVLYPVIAVLSTSVAKGNTFVQTSIFPQSFTLDNYKFVLTQTDFLYWVKNSMIICISVSLIQLVLTATSAFAFAKLKFKGKKYGLIFLLVLQLFPSMMALPAILTFAYSFNLANHMWFYILLQCGGSAFNIWLMKGYMDGLPNELMEAAEVDGASTWQTFTKIILPLSRNMLIVIFIFTFLGTYSEFVFASALFNGSTHETVATGLQSFITGQFSANWTKYAAAAIMASIPITVIYMAFQKYISEGLVAGSVKG